MPNETLVQSLRRRLPDDAHVQMFHDAPAAFAGDNRRRAQHFAGTLRELFAHVLSSRVADAEVEKCVWYALKQASRTLQSGAPSKPALAFIEPERAAAALTRVPEAFFAARCSSLPWRPVCRRRLPATGSIRCTFEDRGTFQHVGSRYPMP
jgi:hypothetical protein